MTIGERIKELRTAEDMTQQELGDKINVGKSTVAQYEHNIRTPSMEIQKLICEFFGVTLDYLNGLSDIKNPYTPKVLAAHSSSNQLSKEDLEDIDRILSIVRSQKNK